MLFSWTEPRSFCSYKRKRRSRKKDFFTFIVSFLCVFSVTMIFSIGFMINKKLSGQIYDVDYSLAFFCSIFLGVCLSVVFYFKTIIPKQCVSNDKSIGTINRLIFFDDIKSIDASFHSESGGFYELKITKKSGACTSYGIGSAAGGLNNLECHLNKYGLRIDRKPKGSDSIDR